MTTLMGTCPVCNGSGRKAASEEQKKYANVLAYYDKSDDTIRCNNCGGQYMYCTPKGVVKHNRSGEPCKHEYLAQAAGRCLTSYCCKHCGDTYQIDSSD